MTYGRIAELARGIARVGTTSHTDAEVYERINEALVEFGTDVFGFPMRDYINIAASFDMRTTMAFHLDLTDATLGNVDADVAITATDVDGQTGAQAATRLQTQIQAASNAGASITVSYSEFGFTLAIPATTTVLAISEPDSVSYSDATEEMFGGDLDTDDIESNSITAGFPLRCTCIQSLPSDNMDIKAVFWDEAKLQELNWEDIIRGKQHADRPSYYAVRGDQIALYPSPTEQGECYILYKGIPAEVDADTEDGTSSVDSIPTRFHYALVYLVASKLCADQMDFDGESKNIALYRSWKRKYLAWFIASQPASEESAKGLWYRVDT